MLNLSVRTKVLSLIILFSLAIIAISISSALSSRSVSSELSQLSNQSLELVKNLEKSRQLLLNQSVEFERGFFQVSIAKSMEGYGVELISESADRFKAFTTELNTSLKTIKETLNIMPSHAILEQLLQEIDTLEQQQSVFLEARI